MNNFQKKSLGRLIVLWSLIIAISIIFLILTPSKLETSKNLTQNKEQRIIFMNKYPFHENIWTTEFWIGEEAGQDNHYISNAQSAWDEKWVEHYGGIDDPKNRKGYYPAGFIPKENPFYCALPYGDEGGKSNLGQVYWYQSGDEKQDSKSILKNRWIKVRANNKSCFCQWEDVGPGYGDDVNYVFGSERPMNEKDGDDHKSGLDISPAMRTCLGISGLDLSSWRFADAENVPDGPWKEIVTTSGTCWIYPESDCH